MEEITLAIIKPDAVKRKLIGQIIIRIEESDLRILCIKMATLSKNILRELYIEHEGKSFLEDLIEFMSSGQVVLLILKGEKAIENLRKICGATDPNKALPGTIRGDYGTSLPYNVIHAPDSPESAKREIGLFFGEEK